MPLLSRRRNRNKTVLQSALIASLSALVLLPCLAGAPALAAWKARPATAVTAPGWEPVIGLGQQIFPSLIVSTATVDLSQGDDEEDPFLIGDPNGFIGAVTDNLPAGSKVKLEIKANPFMGPSSVQGTIAKAGEEYELFPKINWKYNALLKARQVRPLAVVMELFVNGRSRGMKSETATVRSLNDCPIYLLPTDEDGNPVSDESKAAEPGVDMSWMFAAYVNENHPEVEQILKQALQSGVVEAFTGYQDNDPDEVIRQVYAVWNVLQHRGIRYSSITTPSAISKAIYSQHVRLFGDSLKARQTNCIDGTVVFASVLRKIDILSYLVLVPGHAFYAFSLDPDGDHLMGLETTMLGDTNLGKLDSKRLSPQQLARSKNNASWQSFLKALNAGTAELEKSAEKFKSDRAADAEYQLISVEDARNLGIMPLASE